MEEAKRIADEIQNGTAYTLAGIRLFSKNGQLFAKSRQGEAPLSRVEVVEFIAVALELNKPAMKCH